MLNLKMSEALFPNGGEAYSYSQLRNWLESTLGVSPRQAAGAVGAAVRWGFLSIASYTPRGEAIFTK